MYTGNIEEIKDELYDSLRAIRWFYRHQESSGLIGVLPYWCCLDWSPQWVKDFNGLIPGVKEGPTAITQIMLVALMNMMAELFGIIGEKSTADDLTQHANTLRAKTNETFWNENAGLYIDSPCHDVASQLRNAWAILADMLPQPQTQALAEKIAADKSLCQSNYFGDYILFEAWLKMNRPDLTINAFKPYLDMLKNGVSTWPEDSSASPRSDCHAWSNAATYHLLRTVLGFSIVEPGCKTIKIKPYLNGLNTARGCFVTPHGSVSLEFDRNRDSQFKLTVPSNVKVKVETENRQRNFTHGEYSF
jgi:hypothetical protein